MQLGGVVVGIETDLDWSGIKGSTTTNCATTCTTSNSWIGTTRGRIGYAFDRFMPYFTGGGAYGRVKASASGIGSFSSTEVGWTAGGGVEYAFVNNWSAKIEYLYVDLGNMTCTHLRHRPARREIQHQHRARRPELQVLTRSSPIRPGPAARRPRRFSAIHNRAHRVSPGLAKRPRSHYVPD